MQQEIIEQKKEVKNKSKELGPIQKEVLDYFNEVTGRKFKTPKGLASLLKEGYTVDQIKAVILFQSKKWMGDAEMQQYLRPSTLFRPSNFEGYLNNAMQRVDLIEPKKPKLTSEMTMQDHMDVSWAEGL